MPLRIIKRTLISQNYPECTILTLKKGNLRSISMTRRLFWRSKNLIYSMFQTTVQKKLWTKPPSKTFMLFQNIYRSSILGPARSSTALRWMVSMLSFKARWTVVNYSSKNSNRRDLECHSLFRKRAVSLAIPKSKTLMPFILSLKCQESSKPMIICNKRMNSIGYHKNIKTLGWILTI